MQQAPPQSWGPAPSGPGTKGVIPSLFDMNFDHMITTRVIKIVYALAVFPITLLALLLGGYGLDWIARDATFFGFLMLCTAPFLWLFQMLTLRIFLEFVVNQFKISEYLRVIKDKR